MVIRMEQAHWKKKIESFDKRRDIIIPGNTEEAILFSAAQFLEIGREAIQERGIFCVALSGGHTPNAIYRELSKPSYQPALDWSKVLCFWSDERSVPPTDPESNFYTAMEAGLATLPLQPEHIFRMPAEQDIEENAVAYEQLVRQKIPSTRFDLMMLGMGEDGHTASLFPCTHGLHTRDRLVIANYIPQKQTWRMTVTYECIHMSRNICIYAFGAKKANMVATALSGPYNPDQFPIQRVGTPAHKALWILDTSSSEQLVRILDK